MVSLVTGGALRGSTLAGLVQRPAPAISAGWRFGPYVVERLIGQGGAGAVYRARREIGFEQDVAIKVVHASSEWRQRFASEQELLGRLSHRAIVRIFDAGETDGYSWLAMEHVAGLPIDQHFAANRLVWKARVAILAEICDALQYAHRELIVHGDLKPSNVLIGPHRDPKIVDFGIATDLRNADDVPDHAFTPAFASPEQVQGHRLTTAADIYQCGRLLDVLCLQATGHTEVDAAAAVPAWQRRDLEAIVTRATAADPFERYPSASALAADLRNTLSGQPLSARADTRGYRSRVFVRRHRGPIVAAAALALALVGGLVASLWQARIARTYAHEAERQAHNAQRTRDFVVSLLQAGNPEVASGRASRSVAELLLDADARIDRELSDVPASRAEMLVAVGSSLAVLGKTDEGIAALERGVEQLRALGPDARHDLATALHVLATRLVLVSRLDEAAARTEEALRLYDEIGETASLERLAAMTTQARVFGMRGRYHEQNRLYWNILRGRTALVGSDDSRLAVDWNNIGAAALFDDRYAEAERAYREALRVIVHPPATPESRQVWLHAGLGAVYANAWRLEEADRELQTGLEIAARTLPEGHAIVGSLLATLANVRRQQERHEDALAYAQRAVGVFAPISHTDLHTAELQVGLAQAALGRPREALPWFEQSIAHGRQVRGDQEPGVWVAQAAAGLARLQLGERGAVADIQDSVDRLAAQPERSRRSYVRILGLMAQAMQLTGDAAAERHYRQGELELYRELLGADHPLVARLQQTLPPLAG